MLTTAAAKRRGATRRCRGPGRTRRLHKRDSIRRSAPEAPGMLVITSWNVQGLLFKSRRDLSDIERLATIGDRISRPVPGISHRDFAWI